MVCSCKMEVNLIHWQPIRRLGIGILPSKWPVKLLGTHICEYHSLGDFWPSCDEQWTLFSWRIQFGGSGASERWTWGEDEEWPVADYWVPPFRGAIGNLPLPLTRYFWQRENNLRVFLLILSHRLKTVRLSSVEIKTIITIKHFTLNCCLV